MNTVDMMIHVRPALNAQARANLEKNLMEHDGVDCAEFGDEAHLHSLVVRYDPETVKRVEILGVVRETDPDAITVGC